VDKISRFEEEWNRRAAMVEPRRIIPEEAYRKLKSGTTLLVWAYDDDAKHQKMQLEGAISLGQFKKKLPSLSKDQEIIFY
jgi:hypothetical protein